MQPASFERVAPPPILPTDTITTQQRERGGEMERANRQHQ